MNKGKRKKGRSNYTNDGKKINVIQGGERNKETKIRSRKKKKEKTNKEKRFALRNIKINIQRKKERKKERIMKTIKRKTLYRD